MLAMPQGTCSARKRPAKDGREENRFGHGLSNHEDARDEIFGTLSSGKTETQHRKHSV